jgi:uncharacterized heparinase superfamily protein
MTRYFEASRFRWASWLRAHRHRVAARRAALLTRPARLRATLPDALLVGDAALAHDFARGHVSLAGRRVTVAVHDPWRLAAPSPDVEMAMHGFDWLDHALVGGRKDFRTLRGWVVAWIRRYGGGAGPGWTPQLAGRRLARLGPAAGRLLAEASGSESRMLRRSIAAHLRFLRARHAAEDDIVARIEAASGLLIGALSVEGHRGARQTGKRALAALADSVGEDGSVEQRRPDAMAAMFVHLAWTAQALEVAGEVPLPGHAAALKRLGPAVRALRLGDGGLPRFHGGDATPTGLPPDVLDRAFALAGEAARGPRQSACMGYERLSAGRLTVIIDAALPPTDSPSGAASTLGLEIAAGRHRVFGSIGPGASLGGEWPLAARATAAHSAVEIAGVSSARLEAASAATALLGRRLATAPTTVERERSSDLEGLWFRADHDGYLARFGIMVARRLHLTGSGADLRGEDSLTCPSLRARQRFDAMAENSTIPFYVRFHLPPEVEAETGADEKTIWLRLPDGGSWRFSGSGGPVRLAESVSIDGIARLTRRTKQIVIHGQARAYFGRVTWSLVRADQAAPGKTDRGAAGRGALSRASSA